MQIMVLRWGIVVVALVITVLVYLYLFPRSRPSKNGIPLWEGYEVIEKEVGGKKLKLVVAESSSQWQQGLMHVRKPVPFDGMIFISKHAVPQVFWNMNTFEDLDIYWLKNDEIIGTSFLPSIEKKGMTTVASPGRADTVIEVIK